MILTSFLLSKTAETGTDRASMTMYKFICKNHGFIKTYLLNHNLVQVIKNRFPLVSIVLESKKEVGIFFSLFPRVTNPKGETKKNKAWQFAMWNSNRKCHFLYMSLQVYSKEQ